jgi:predicted phosphate transport protein (TIGR00153 family)
MFSRLIPREEQFFDLLVNGAVNAVKATTEFKLLVEQWDVNSPRFKTIRQIETEGDLITHEVIDKLNRTFITPIDREDIHRLAGEIDDVCDIIQALSDRMQLYELESTMPETFIKMAVLLDDSCRNMESALKEIHKLRTNSRVSDHCIEIKRIENEADELLKHALASIFKAQKDALWVIKWKEIYETIEFAHDKLSHIANTVEGILVKNA